MKNSYVNNYTKTVQTYIKELSNTKYTPIPREIEEDLFRKYREGDTYSLKQLADAHLRLVVNMAKRFNGRGVDIEDLIAEGNIGLLNAIERFDSSKNVRLCVYAKWWIMKAMNDAIAAKTQISNNENNMPQSECLGDENLFEKTNIERQKNIIETIDEDENINYYKETVDILLSKLDSRSRFVIESYYGLMDKDQLTLIEISKKLNISQERVRQIKDRAMATIRGHALMENISMERAT